MREHFERASCALIEVDPYKRTQRASNTNAKPVNVSAIDFSAGRGTTGVDLRWYPCRDFLKLPANQKTELMEWTRTDAGRELITEFKQERDKTNGNNSSNNSNIKRKSDSDNGNNGNWKKELKGVLRLKRDLKQSCQS